MRLIWVVDSEQKTVTVYRPNNERARLAGADSLTGENVLPEFSVSVSEIFA